VDDLQASLATITETVEDLMTAGRRVESLVRKLRRLAKAGRREEISKQLGILLFDVDQVAASWTKAGRPVAALLEALAPPQVH
jgi:hypothetical protein